MSNNNPDSEENQDYLEVIDDNEYYETRADREKQRLRQAIDGNAFIPFELYAKATWEMKIKSDTIKSIDSKQRVTGSSYCDAILLYGFLQYTRQWHEHKGRVNDGAVYCTPSYISKGLHWGNRRSTRATKLLEQYKLITRKKVVLKNINTNQLEGSQTWWEINN